MSSQDVRIVIRPASGQIGNHDVQDVRGDHDAVSDLSADGPPDYATLDPNELNRSVTPFPRPKSPTPSSAPAPRGWPLAGSDDGSRSDSSKSCTSSRLRNKRAKSQSRKFKRISPKTVNRPDPIASRRNRKRALSTSSAASSKSPTKKMLQIPAMARITSRRGDDAFTHVTPSGSISTLANNQPSGSQKKRGLVSQLSHGDWTTIGSFFSQSANSSSSHRGVEISQPYNFRHEGGIGSSSSAFIRGPDNTHNADGDEPSRTSRILMDIRTESRLGNRTSLPVHLPNAFSPIDASMFDADCGHKSSVRPAVRKTVNPFQSPPSSEETVYQQQPSGKDSPGNDAELGDAHIDTTKASVNRILFWAMAALTQICLTITVASITIAVCNDHNDEKIDGGATIALVLSLAGALVFGVIFACLYAHRLTGRIVREYTGVRMETFFFKLSPERVTYWALAILAEVAFISTGAAVTVITLDSHHGLDVDAGIIAWLIVSIISFIVLGLALASLYTRRVSNRLVRAHRAEQQNEEWFELHSGTQRNFSHRGDQRKLARDIIKSVTQDGCNIQANQEQTAFGHGGFRHINSHDQVSNTIAGRDSQRVGQNMTQIQNPRASLIGIARSDSLMRHPNNPTTPSMSSSIGTAETYESEGTEKPIISKQSSPPAAHPRSDPTTILSAEEMSMISMPKQKQSYIPHSLAMADLSSEAPQHLSPSVTTSNTKSTIASLISSYASEPGARISNEPITRAYSPESLGRRQDALHSHPVSTSLRPIVTEAGTPNSQKSDDRVLTVDTGMKTDWSIRDGLATRMTTMTPIEERSEAGTRSSLLTGRRVSQSQASEYEMR
ncbi:hypothetical protein SCAR479_05298 [Seiridium cardinale]|uniref:Transmembrane protein n=1 Tax=Seiridium cardinale TaxID=138064 RepID=A0ABR2XW13_9PEZI